MTAPPRAVPLSLTTGAVLMEEGVARISHALRNHLAAVRNAAFYVAKRVGRSELASDPRLIQFLKMIDDELETATQVVGRGVVSAGVRPRATERLHVAEVVAEAARAFEAAGGAQVESALEPCEADVDPEELRFAVRLALETLQRQCPVTRLELSLKCGDAELQVCMAAQRKPGPTAALAADIELSWALVRRVALLNLGHFDRVMSDDRVVVVLSLPASQQRSSAERPPCVLLIDDDPVVRISLGALLEDEGFQVVESESFASASFLLQSKPSSFELVLLDQHLADRSGLELLPMLRATQPDAKIVLASGDQGEVPAGVDARHVKGEPFPQLLECLQQLVPVRGGV
jgi:CheY-like chemotaxis protein